MTPKLDARLLREDIADGVDEAIEARWVFCECSMCYDCTDDTDDTDDTWAKIDPAWQWVRYAPRRWIAPVAA